ncbi:unnamed protein product, partial [Strongylus vulgaris]
AQGHHKFFRFCDLDFALVAFPFQANGVYSSVPPLPDEIEERKKIFDETVERVQDKFFAYHRENVCADNEKEIMECLKANPDRILKCAHLSEVYEKCVADFRQEVLKGN